MSFLFSNPAEAPINAATDAALPYNTPDLPAYLEIADKIKSGQLSPTDAVKALKKRLTHSNPNVVLLTLHLTDTLVKNSGSAFIKQVAQQEFIDQLVGLVDTSAKALVLQYIQGWQAAFKGKPGLGYVEAVYVSLKAQGHVFPPPEAVSAVMVETVSAPEWSDSDVCMRCRTPFSTFNRKHHCRACGECVCGECSKTLMELPQLGILQQVRVCDGCVEKKNSGTLFKESKKEASQKEDDDLKRALEASLRDVQPRPVARVESDDELEAAIKASLRDQEERERSQRTESDRPHPVQKSTEIPPDQLDTFDMFSTLIERIHADPAAHSSILYNTQIQGMYASMGGSAPRLQQAIAEAREKMGLLTALEGKILAGCRGYEKIVQQRIQTGYSNQQQPYQLPYQQQYQFTQPPFGHQFNQPPLPNQFNQLHLPNQFNQPPREHFPPTNADQFSHPDQFNQHPPPDQFNQQVPENQFNQQPPPQSQFQQPPPNQFQQPPHNQYYPPQQHQGGYPQQQYQGQFSAPPPQQQPVDEKPLIDL